MRPLNFFFFAILAASGYLISAESLKMTTVLVKIMLSMLFLTLSANVLNEFSSSKVFSIIRHFYTKAKKKDANQSVIASFILFTAGFLVAYTINFYTLQLYLLIAVLLWAYLHNLKNVRFIRSIFISSAASISIILGSNVVGSSDAVYMMVLLLFFSNMAGDMVKSITEGMKNRSVFLINFLRHFSSYIRFDDGRTGKSAAIMLAVFIILSPVPYVLGVMPIKYLGIVTLGSLVAFVAIFNLIKDGKSMAALSKVDELIKINMLITVIAFLAGVLM